MGNRGDAWMYPAPSANSASAHPLNSRPGCDGRSNGTASPELRPPRNGQPVADRFEAGRWNQVARRARLFAGTRRNRIVVAGVRRHRLANFRMAGEERAELRMLLGVPLVIDQRRIVRKLARDLRMPARELVPGLKPVRVQDR